MTEESANYMMNLPDCSHPREKVNITVRYCGSLATSEMKCDCGTIVDIIGFKSLEKTPVHRYTVLGAIREYIFSLF